MEKTVGERIRAIAAAKGLGDGEELAARFDVTYETLRKWTKGLAAPNRSRQLVIAEVLGVPIPAFMHGDPAIERQESSTEADFGFAPNSIPSTFSWETLLTSHQYLPQEFTAAVPDDALRSSSPRGTMFVFSRDAAPEPGKAVLVRDRDGNLYVRRYAQGTGGRWTAQATNDAYASLDSERDGLVIVAVATWRSGGDA